MKNTKGRRDTEPSVTKPTFQTAIKTPKGEKNILVGYDCVQGYLSSHSYCGSTVGRVANRIAGAKFTLDGKEWHISPNENGVCRRSLIRQRTFRHWISYIDEQLCRYSYQIMFNCLHGGEQGFDKRFYEAETDGDTLTLSLVSKDGDMGFPGNLHFKAEFTLEGRSLTIKYYGISDKTTLFSPTCHAYFNMNGGGEVMGNLLKINADNYTPVDEQLIPLGRTESVKGTPLDFTELKRIGEDYVKLGGKTYDHNFCLNNSLAVTAVGEKSGIKMEMQTDLPGLQLYVGKPAAYNGKGGGYGFCLEPQYYPNAVNVEGFETPILKENEEKHHYINLLFDCMEETNN